MEATKKHASFIMPLAIMAIAAVGLVLFVWWSIL
jgi:hypothetical protein